MNGLNFSNNLIKLRHDKKITQEDLANFLGITKASVSKWETKQSLPDIMLLPQLATFFDTTIDELLGYEPQLSKEQIQKIYHDLAKNFETEDFEKVIDKSQKLIKKYYSCYPFLLQMSVLYLNHFLITDNRERQIEILTLASDLCSHISENCKDIGVCNDAIFLKASIDLQLGKANEAINSIEEILNPYRFSNQGDIILIQAYQLAGDIKKSNEFTQISMFNHLIFLVHCAIQYINIHSNNIDICENAINRIDKLINSFNLSNIHPNTVCIFYYQAAITYAMNQKDEKALTRLKMYIDNSYNFIKNKTKCIYSDDFFDSLDKIYEESDFGTNLPRSKKFIYETALHSLEHPAFASICENDDFKEMKKNVLNKWRDIYEQH